VKHEVIHHVAEERLFIRNATFKSGLEFSSFCFITRRSLKKRELVLLKFYEVFDEHSERVETANQIASERSILLYFKMLGFPIGSDCFDEVQTSQEIVFDLSQEFLPFLRIQQDQALHGV
jgi:hypothetical protein